MQQILKSGCELPQNKINSELFLEVVNTIMVTKGYSFKSIKAKDYTQKISLVAKCSADK